ncbi:MAG: hypothetical protein ICV73_13750, partial [Acetobacteraceae bacterium]|nr:hypothetical protein [Acetobacteraceae bacterium]
MTGTRRAERALDALNLFLSDVRYGLGAYLAVYLLERHAWDEAGIGVALSACATADPLAQTPVGLLLEGLRAKRPLVAGAVPLVTATARSRARAAPLGRAPCWSVTPARRREAGPVVRPHARRRPASRCPTTHQQQQQRVGKRFDLPADLVPQLRPRRLRVLRPPALRRPAPGPDRGHPPRP